MVGCVVAMVGMFPNITIAVALLTPSEELSSHETVAVTTVERFLNLNVGRVTGTTVTTETPSLNATVTSRVILSPLGVARENWVRSKYASIGVSLSCSPPVAGVTSCVHDDGGVKFTDLELLNITSPDGVVKLSDAITARDDPFNF
jgi:hypothetical protein